MLLKRILSGGAASDTSKSDTSVDERQQFSRDLPPGHQIVVRRGNKLIKALKPLGKTGGRVFNFVPGRSFADTSLDCELLHQKEQKFTFTSSDGIPFEVYFLYATQITNAVQYTITNRRERPESIINQRVKLALDEKLSKMSAQVLGGLDYSMVGKDIIRENAAEWLRDSGVNVPWLRLSSADPVDEGYRRSAARATSSAFAVKSSENQGKGLASVYSEVAKRLESAQGGNALDDGAVVASVTQLLQRTETIEAVKSLALPLLEMVRTGIESHLGAVKEQREQSKIGETVQPQLTQEDVIGLVEGALEKVMTDSSMNSKLPGAEEPSLGSEEITSLVEQAVEKALSNNRADPEDQDATTKDSNEADIGRVLTALDQLQDQMNAVISDMADRETPRRGPVIRGRKLLTPGGTGRSVRDVSKDLRDWDPNGKNPN